MAVTRQVPALVAVSAPFEIEQPLAEPLVTVKLTAPVPEPPDVASARAVPTVPPVDVTLRAAWAASTCPVAEALETEFPT